MSANLILISRFATKPGMADHLASSIPTTDVLSVLHALEGNEVVTLEAVSPDIPLDTLRGQLTAALPEYAQYLSSDIRRELLEFIEAPKPSSNLIPDTPYVQLRHIEVKPDMMTQYRQWREDTIFDVVRSADDISEFSAYHSIISGQPGVMFISGFSVEPESYTRIFESERYRAIVQEAGDLYITGGTSGLYTQIYRTDLADAA